MQHLYSALVAIDGGTHYPHKAYEHGSPAEQLFKRFQQQVTNKMWFSDGQSITVRNDDNKMNKDFIMEHKHKLKTTAELEQAFALCVRFWNEAQHPKLNCSRQEAYNHSMAYREELSMQDVQDLMWIEQSKRPITYKAHGLDLWLGDKLYQYEVYDAYGNIDLDFRKNNIGKKFIVRYDPEYLDQYISLCEKDANGNLLTISHAQPKRSFTDIPKLMKEGEKAQMLKDKHVRELVEVQNTIKNLERKTGISREALIEEQDLLIKFKGQLPKQQRNELESDENILHRI